MSRGLGPLTVPIHDPSTGNVVQKPIKDVLGTQYLPLEQVKADAAGLYLLVYLVNNQMLTLNFTNMGMEDNPYDVLARRCLYVTSLSYILHKSRTGSDINSWAARVVFSFLRENKAIVLEKETRKNEEGHTFAIYKYGINFSTIEHVLKRLVGEILRIEATSTDETQARAFMQKYNVMSDEQREVLARTANIPIAIMPEFSIHEKLFGKRDE